MIRHPLSAPSTFGDTPTALAQRQRISRPHHFSEDVRFFWLRRWQPTAWLLQCSRELIRGAIFQARSAQALAAAS